MKIFTLRQIVKNYFVSVLLVQDLSRKIMKTWVPQRNRFAAKAHDTLPNAGI